MILKDRASISKGATDRDAKVIQKLMTQSFFGVIRHRNTYVAVQIANKYSIRVHGCFIQHEQINISSNLKLVLGTQFQYQNVLNKAGNCSVFYVAALRELKKSIYTQCTVQILRSFLFIRLNIIYKLIYSISFKK